MPVWLRWVLVVPGAVGAFVLQNIILGFMFGLGDKTSETSLPNFMGYWSDFIRAAVPFYFLVWTASLIAPSRKFLVAIIFAACNAMFQIGSLVLVFKGMPDEDPLWWASVISITALIAGVAGCYDAYKDRQEEF